MIEIASLSNQTVKDTVKLHQKKYRKDNIILEGIKTIEGAIEAGLEIRYIFSCDEKILSKYDMYTTYLADDKVMKKISTTENAPAALAVAKKPDYNSEEFRKFKKIALIDSAKDAGNLGTIIRTAAAFGIEGILLYGDTVDEFSTKTIRSAAGNIFKIPVIKTDLEEIKNFKKTHTLVAAVVDKNASVQNVITEKPIIIMLGSEAEGLCEELLNIKDKCVTIPMQNNVESLNIAVSGAIIFYIMQNE